MRVLPRYPRINPVVTLHITESGVIVDGLQAMEVIRGVAAEMVLPHIVPFFDGTNTVADILEALPTLPEEYIRTTLERLSDWGILEDSQANNDEAQNAIAAFVTRSCLGRSTNDSELSPLRLLSSARVRIEGPLGAIGDFDKRIGRMLGACHIGSISYDAPRDRQSVFGNIARLTLQFPGDSPQKVHLDATLNSTSNYLLVRSIVCQTCDGPSCCDLYHRKGINGRVENCADDLLDLISSLVISEVIDCILGSPNALVGRRSREYDLGTLASVIRQYPRSPHCSGCNVVGEMRAAKNPTDKAREVGNYSTAWVYCEQVGHISPTQRGNHVRTSRSKRILQTEDVYAGESIPLPAHGVNLNADSLEALIGKRRRHSGEITSPKLGALCALSAGIKEKSSSSIKHWAPSAGNFGASKLYFITRGICDLVEGAYAYDASSHSSYRRGLHCQEHLVDLLKTLSNWKRPHASTLLVYTVRRDVLANKYGAFSYKLGFLDGGCALAQAQMVAGSMGLIARPIESWPDKSVSDALGLYEDVEHITSILALYKSEPLSLFHKKRWYASQHGFHGAEYFRDLSLEQLTESLAKECETGESAFVPESHLSRRGGGVSANHGTTPAGTGSSGISMCDLLAYRQSTRDYSSQPIREVQLSTALECAFSVDQRNWPIGIELGVDLDCYVLCRAVQNLREGVYRFDQHSMQLVFSSTFPRDVELASLYAQRECASAAATIIIAADVIRANEAMGAFGFRHLLVRASAAAHTASLASLAQGLGSVVLAGIIPDIASLVLGLHDSSQLILIGCAIGHPKEPYADM